MLKLVKTPEKPRAAASLTMGGRPPARFPNVAPGLTYAQGVAAGAMAMPQVTRPGLRLVSSQG